MKDYKKCLKFVPRYQPIDGIWPILNWMIQNYNT